MYTYDIVLDNEGVLINDVATQDLQLKNLRRCESYLTICLSALAANPASKLNILGHNSHTLGMKSA